MKRKKAFEDWLLKKTKSNERNKEILEKYREIYSLFIKASRKEEIQEIERWLLR